MSTETKQSVDAIPTGDAETSAKSAKPTAAAKTVTPAKSASVAKTKADGQASAKTRTATAKKAKASRSKTAGKKKSAAKPAPAAAKTGNKTMNDTIENMTAASNDALKDGFEKTLKSVTEVSNFQKQNVDAVIESATLAAKGMETVNANSVAYAKTLMEDGVNAGKAIASAKSVQDIYEIQAGFAKTAMDQYLAELNKTSELVADTFKTALKPINDRVTATVDMAQSQR
ncbi:phasin family protein [Maricaulis sp. CAU 1757]